MAGFVSFLVMVALTIAAFLTGEPADELIKGLPVVSGAAIEQNDDSAMIAFIMAGV